MQNITKKRVLAVASAGGHWVQLLRLQPAWEDCHIAYISTSQDRKNEVIEQCEQQQKCIPAFYVIVDATRWEKMKLLKQLCQIFLILLKERPQIIISTGAAPGFFALKLGKLIGARTIWVDSIANTKEMSLSGKKISSSADLWLTQWEHLADSVQEDGKRPQYKGSVI